MQTKLITLLLFFSISLTAQYSENYSSHTTKSKATYSFEPSRSHVSLQYFGWTFHPGGGAVNMVKNYPLKLDKKAFVVANIGLSASYDYDLSNKWFLRATATYLKDCAFQNSGYLHFGIRFKGIQFGKHSFNGGIGPTLAFRNDWHKFEGYKDSDMFGKHVWNGMQYFLVPYGGEVEYMYKINEKWDFQYSVIPGFPAIISSRIGFRMKL
jgi:hypothetical protein